MVRQNPLQEGVGLSSLASWPGNGYTYSNKPVSQEERGTVTTRTASRPQLSTAFYGFVLIGVASGAWGVLLPSLSTYYHIDQSVVGLLFFASAIGYFLSALSSGFLLTKFGLRCYLLGGTGLFLLCDLCIVLQPSFTLVLIIRLLQGMAVAIIEAGLNMFLARLPNNTALLNFLHAFYGAGALIGPLIASTILALSWGWNSAFLIWALLALPLLISLFTLFRRLPINAPQAEQAAQGEHGLLAILKLPVVWLATLFLLFYVGIEVSLGNWSYTFLLTDRHENELLAGWVVSGYWLGLTVGRFILNAIAERLRLSLSGLMYLCLGGVILGIAIIWLIPSVIASAIALFLIGTSLGPIYPSTVALLPRIVPGQVVSSAMGFLIGISILGIALFPWIAGVLAQYIGIWSLLPYTSALTLITLALWWPLSRRPQEAAPAKEAAANPDIKTPEIL
jgi:fucose permease